ncbi:MAG: hypothetical protein A3J07_01145 [Candidatus Doudnabacteria bacterium RIFCSPLOWO2_02_FULL_49_13]|uniref:TrpR like protein, YerC/YecD n=1 Tax=Candidatus Doudnabacteria bacterium RIFCSPHIGHO2_12_FULL_48_16 TaxID=1817838 RepID=A0A1F5PK96_9BACT|nr:MAG: hypothetical protein A3B77_04075 [Candidatus Doudnabacteria bacterium RIFCSPHIGHO2_02_FULL_49_24]OGE88661.1 MAG: hypothetical protein A2760_01735 [Candidatus Doudnabacteria bacterium RIFCSPHIGHO2_01_FULL_50_67]OGE90346.1 MAG: hypothetical protein A3E29_04655 [Candidatus Doudnabacteria bacterium RIFCSPHIGHO2_12_FULL_48_16]OGE97053.1 MAG: hypothetical protein A2990_01645 [Candidatus Doudnabacteria bacterium RIFCSPLOWO2_01_FULL_49_40]OGF02402.1 MAG: hypothetical protein A3J07_01145 [Candid
MMIVICRIYTYINVKTVKNRLTKQQQEGLLIKLARAVASVNRAEEGAKFLRDLLSEPEVFMLARRLQIAELLMDGLTYEQIREELNVGYNTIAKVQTWLELYGDGYRTVINRTIKNKVEKNINEPFTKLKRKYPISFWPQLLLEEMIRNANQREKQRLRNVVEGLRNKTQLSRELTKLLAKIN